tara:strand:+ start:527 stop:1057 length:531 start_codon:yes stop_codon:yes gene_type:complete
VVQVVDKVHFLVIQAVQVVEEDLDQEEQDVELLEQLVKDMRVEMAILPILEEVVEAQVPLVQILLLVLAELVEQERTLVLFLELPQVSVEYLLVAVEALKESVHPVDVVVQVAADQDQNQLDQVLLYLKELLEQKILAVVGAVLMLHQEPQVRQQEAEVKELLLLKKERQLLVYGK